MLFSRYSKIMGSIAMSAILTNAPSLAMAESGMIATHTAVEELNEPQTLQRVQDFLSRADVQQLLIERGLTSDEATKRIASLSEMELRQLSGQIEQARAGGDALVTILIIVLIVFLVTRI